ncbi:hypothetical protein B296_00019105 [Ensete ventricosum]|uniref:RRM domain-containing protein n=1 Tax=Ensete ventricosum TaxID=4639 RepID=A0A426ZPD7_ENSVE|nr:hypothetical protein B296_00019105 [Ensete ventricosum]
MAPGQGTQQQFRYTQTPSKVLHVRNLPWDCAEEELVALCRPFGKIVNTMCNVGANKNQAFVEFVRTCSLWFCDVLLYLLPEHITTCHLRITYSAHTDLSIKFQSHRSRDYTNPFLPVNPSAIEGSVQVHNDRGRDYTVQDTGVLMTSQAPSLPTTAGWQVYPQSTSTYIGNDFTATGQVTVPQGQVTTWNPSLSSGSFASASNMFPSQTFATPVSHYPVSTTSSAPAGLLQASQESSQYGLLANAVSAAAPTTQPPYYTT